MWGGTERWPPVDGIFRRRMGGVDRWALPGAGGQDCPSGGGGDPDAYLRGGIPGVQLRVPARAWTARCSGRARVWAGEAADQLGPRRGYSVVLRHDQPGVWLIRFIEHRIERSADRQADPQMALAAGVLEEGRKIETVEGTPARRGSFRRRSRTCTCTTSTISGFVIGGNVSRRAI